MPYWRASGECVHIAALALVASERVVQDEKCFLVGYVLCPLDITHCEEDKCHGQYRDDRNGGENFDECESVVAAFSFLGQSPGFNSPKPSTL